MQNLTTPANELAKRVLQEFRNGRHYRDIARDDFPRRADGSQIVKAGTLNRIVKSEGCWLPKNKEILIALGLRQGRKPIPEWKKQMRQIVKQINALIAERSRQ